MLRLTLCTYFYTLQEVVLHININILIIRYDLVRTIHKSKAKDN